MFPNVSNQSHKPQKGFTLIEVAVVVIVSLIAAAIVIRFYKDSYHTFSQQEQIEERNQNANFTVSKMVEIMQQAGAALPDSDWTVVKDTNHILTVGSNPSGFSQFVGADIASSNTITIKDASRLKNTNQPLMNTTHILIDSVGAAKVGKFQIDTNKNSSGFIKGIKDTPSDTDFIYLTVATALKNGDWIFGYREDEYLLLTDSLVIRPNGDAGQQVVLAENIDSLGFTFRNKAGNVTGLWKNMRSVSMTVRARTSKRDPKIPAPGFHYITLPMNVILRNKV